MKSVITVLGLGVLLAACGQKYRIDTTNSSPTDDGSSPFIPFDASPDGVGPGSNYGGTPPGGYPVTPPSGTTPTGNNPTNPTGGNPTTPTGGTPTTPTGGTPGTPSDPTNPTGGNPTNPGNPVTPPGGEVCEPFGPPSVPTPTSGPQINGKLYVGPQPTSTTVNGVTTVQQISSVNKFFKRDDQGRDIYMQPTTLFFSEINAPQRAFDKGFFNLNNDPIKEPGSDQILDENFAMSLGSNLKLDDGDATGQYQFAVVSDDGANLYIDNNGSPLNILNDTWHPPALRCASETVYLNKNTRLPFRLDYYQGPRFHIALVVLWRKIADGANPSALTDPMCMPDMFQLLPTADQDKFSLWENVNGRSEYTALLQRGWKVLKPGNFILGADTIQPPVQCIPKTK